MDRRLVEIYTLLYRAPQSKKALAERFGVTTKTVENIVARSEGDIVYDRKIGAFRFASLLPRLIPPASFYAIFKESVAGELPRRDFERLFLQCACRAKGDTLPPLPLPTDGLTPLGQKVIACEVAVAQNAVLEIVYHAVNQAPQTKWIRPRKVVCDASVFYLYATYDEQNGIHTGEGRTFAVNGIVTMKPVAYVKNGHFRLDIPANAYGPITKEQSATLRLEGAAAHFFRREGLLGQPVYEFVQEEPDGSLILKIYYNSPQEIVHLAQSWMPLITVLEPAEAARKVRATIEQNTRKFLSRQKGAAYQYDYERSGP